MSDDIVNELRDMAFTTEPDWVLVECAAEEIEILRKELDDWKKTAAYEHAGYCPCTGQDENHLLFTLEYYVRENKDWKPK